MDYFQVHIQEQDVWYFFGCVPVKALSADPNIPDSLLGGLDGTFNLRVCAKNAAGRGVCSEQIVVLHGNFCYFSNF